MTSMPAEDSRTTLGTTGVVERVGACVEELAVLAGRGSLVESATGRLVAHDLRAAEAVPAPVLDALVRGDLSVLHAALTRRRSVGLLPTGAVLTGVLAPSGTKVAYLSLRDAGVTTGGAWLLLGADPPSLEQLRDPAQHLASLLACTSGDDAQDALAACLAGLPDAQLPPHLRDAEQLWVAALSPVRELTTEAVVRALSSACGTSAAPFRARATRLEQQPFVVLAGGRRTTTTQALHTVERVVTGAAQRLGIPLCAALSEPMGPDALAVARAQATAAVGAGPGSGCFTVGSVRSAVMLRHVGDALTTLPDLGRDPLLELDDYDSRRGGELGLSLLAWLDAFGDATQAAAELGIHENTLRYRVKRSQEILGTDLKHDPAARLALHLRLHTRHQTRPLAARP
jgi:hypothetical protein